jgi:hypothetical protein
MRHKLQAIQGDRQSFIAKFGRYGQTKKGYYDPYHPTILLQDLTTVHNHTIVADHLWVQLKNNPSLYDHTFKQGDYLEFLATVEPYRKGYQGKRIDLIISRPVRTDYHLAHITDVRVITDDVIMP